MSDTPFWQPRFFSPRQLLPNLYHLSIGASTLVRGTFLPPLRFYDGDPRDGGALVMELTARKGAILLPGKIDCHFMFTRGIYILGTGMFDDVLIAGGTDWHLFDAP